MERKTTTINKILVAIIGLLVVTVGLFAINKIKEGKEAEKNILIEQGFRQGINVTIVEIARQQTQTGNIYYVDTDNIIKTISLIDVCNSIQ